MASGSGNNGSRGRRGERRRAEPLHGQPQTFERYPAQHDGAEEREKKKQGEPA